VTRASILELVRSGWGQGAGLGPVTVSERWLTMGEVQRAEKDGRLLEAFGAGTAVVISPVSSIVYGDDVVHLPLNGQPAGPMASSLWQALMDIQYGRTDSPWSVLV